MIDQTENIDLDALWKESEKKHKRGKIIGGIFVVIAGSIFLAKELGAQIPDWVFTWKMLLIAIGLIIGAKNNFKQTGWIVFVIIGGVFLAADIYPHISIKPFLWPVLIILIGIAMIFKPQRKYKHQQWKRFQNNRFKENNRFNRERECYAEESTSTDDTIDFTTFMGGVKKNILSKNFKGGDISNVFGGTELNLSQADIDKTATLDLTNVFGGTKLIIPSNWEIHSELVSICGSIEDKRSLQTNTSADGAKILILKGTTFMGGIDIKNY